MSDEKPKTDMRAFAEDVIRRAERDRARTDACSHQRVVAERGKAMDDHPTPDAIPRKSRRPCPHLRVVSLAWNIEWCTYCGAYRVLQLQYPTEENQNAVRVAVDWEVPTLAKVAGGLID